MYLELILIAVLPAVVYVIADMKYGMKAGIITSILIGIFLAFWLFLKMGEIDRITLCEIGFLIALGLLSLKLNNSKLFKFQPTVIGTLIAVYILYSQFFLEPVLIHMRPMTIAMAPEMADRLNTPQMTEYLRNVSWLMAPLFLTHAAMCAYAALNLSNARWAITKILIYPMLLGLMIFSTYIYR